MDTDRVPVFFLMYENIENMKEIKNLLLKNELNAAVVNPELVYHKDQLLLASHKSLYNERTNQMKTKSIFTELLYNLYPTRRISESLKTFGVQENGSAAIFVAFQESVLKNLKNCIKGQYVPLDRISQLRNAKSIRKLYKVPEHVNDENSIVGCILMRTATKELLL